MPDIYFSFPDGVYHYDCGTCSALCCRGQGIGGSLNKEMPRLISLYPHLGNLAISRQGDVVSFVSPHGRCYFLDDADQCQIEKTHGLELKPGVCRLFPFNRILRIGKTLAVSINFLCPVSLCVTPKQTEVLGRHSKIKKTVYDTGLLEGEVASQILLSDEDGARVVATERNFLDLCSLHLENKRFYETLSLAYSKEEQLNQFIERASRVLDIEYRKVQHAADNTDRMLHALGPTLRLDMLNMPPDARIRALAMLEVMLRNAASLGRGVATVQGAYRILKSTMKGIGLLARYDEPLVTSRMTSQHLELPRFNHPELTLAAAIAMKRLQKGAQAIEAIEAAIDPSMPPYDRAALLVQLGSLIDDEKI